MNKQPMRAEARCVIYWMQKDQRSRDNWALVRAIEVANEHKVPVVVAFFVWEGMKNAYVRHYDFMLRGLGELAADLSAQQIGCVMRHLRPVDGIVGLCRELKPIMVVTDQAYLLLGKQRRAEAGQRLPVLLEAVDAAMIVPPAVLSDKQLYASYIARPRLRDQFDRFLTNYPELSVAVPWSSKLDGLEVSQPETVLALLKLDDSAGAVKQASGMTTAQSILKVFISEGVGRYKDTAGDPMASSTSQLSAYLHYGQISAQRVVWELKHAPTYARDRDSIDKYLDELVTWRELSTNFAAYNTHYNTYDGTPDWAKKTLAAHADDEREYIYTSDDFEQAKTHDELWNAAQLEMMKTGRMHGYMRMYWAKKILEWTPSPQQAMRLAVYLNDKYELDGREPNGYAGIMWAIGGLHDRPWFEREVYGQIRYMNYNGAKKKFNVNGYINWVNQLEE